MKRMILFILASLVLCQPAAAILIDRGCGMIYDTDQDITWLKNANSAQLQPNEYWGLMSLDTALAFAAGFEYHDPVQHITFSDWRLPTTPVEQEGFNITTSEMGYMYYVNLGNTAESGTLNSGPFDNLQTSSYWSDTRYSADPNTYLSWQFFFDTGRQGPDVDSDPDAYVWLVRDGDHWQGDPNVVPEPATILLVTLGFLGFQAAGRRWKKRHEP